MKFLRMKVFLNILLLLNILKSDEVCKREIVEAYGIQSYYSPRSLNLYLFPSIQATCCPIFDQLEMFVNYRDRIRPNLNRYYDQLQLGVVKMIKVVNYIERMQIGEMIKFFKFPLAQTDMMTFRWDNLLKRYKIGKNLRLLKTLQPKANKFMNDLKKTFYGVICDYENQEFLDLEEKTMSLSIGTCQLIAKNTIDFAFQLNVVTLKILYDLLDILDKFTDSTVSLKFKLDEYDDINSAVRMCKRSSVTGNWQNCAKYCSYFNFNSFSPVMEGYRNHFNEILLIFAGFVNKYPRFAPKKPFANKYKIKKFRILQDKPKKHGRLLQTSKVENKKDSLQPKQSQRLTRILQLLDLNKLRRSMNTESAAINYVKKKRMQVIKPFYVPKRFIPHDVYQPTHLDGSMDDAAFGKMATGEFFREKLIHKNYVQFIQNTLFDATARESFINPEDNLFLELPKDLIGLEDFKTVIDVDGINLRKILKSTKIGKSYKNLLSGMKKESPYEMDYETLDKIVLHQINDINNNMVREFHKDNFMKFKNLSYRAKRDKIKKMTPAEKMSFNKFGYRIAG